MSRHHRYDNYARSAPFEGNAQHGTGRLRPIVWVLAGLAMLLWSALASLAYIFAVPLFDWIVELSGVALKDGRSAAETWGGKPVGDALKAIDTTKSLGVVIDWIRSIGGPLIVTIWILGILVLALAPVALSIIGRMYFRGRR